jgi:hypothetical protein
MARRLGKGNEAPAVKLRMVKLGLMIEGWYE